MDFKMKWNVLFTLFLMVSCTNITTNLADSESYFLRNGYFNGKEKKTELKFTRHAWSKEFTLVYDLRMALLNEESPYFDWLSESSKKDVRNCSEFYVVIAYDFQGRFVTHREITTMMSRYGAEEQLIPDFKQEFQLHPDFERENLQRHQVKAWCFKNPTLNKITLNLPGFNTVTILD